MFFLFSFLALAICLHLYFFSFFYIYNVYNTQERYTRRQTGHIYCNQTKSMIKLYHYHNSQEPRYILHIRFISSALYGGSWCRHLPPLSIKFSPDKSTSRLTGLFECKQTLWGIGYQYLPIIKLGPSNLFCEFYRSKFTFPMHSKWNKITL